VSVIAARRSAEVRTNRRHLKRELAGTPYPDSLVRAARILVEPKADLLSMRVFDLLRACGGVGRIKAEQLLGDAGVPTHRQIGDLSRCEQRAILEEFATRGREYRDRRRDRAA
jgi:predicted flap endonuclease-1-like 5' DNA nuclease